MTAHGFIDQLFSRPSFGLDGNMRRLTPGQLDLLRNLIGEDEEGGAVQRGANGSLIWMPSGRPKYVITEDPRGGKHILARFSNLKASASGSLF